MPWQQFTYTVTASNTASVFAFHAYDQTANVLLDNVSVTLLTGPQLGVSLTGPNLVLTWTNSATGFTLQTSTNLNSAASWTNLATVPVIQNGLYTVTNAISGPRQYFRLSQ